MIARLTGIAGFDPAIVEQLPPRLRWTMAGHAALALCACGVAAASSAYAASLAFGSRAAEAAGACFAGGLVLATLRLVNAGTGPAPAWGRDRVRQWRPSFVGLYVFLFWGVLLAQPYLLWRAAGPLDEALEARSAGLAKDFEEEMAQPMRRQHATLAASGNDRHANLTASLRTGIAAAEALSVQLVSLRQHESLLAERWQLLWRSRGKAAVNTLIFMLLFSLPMVVRVWPHAALRVHDEVAVLQARELILAAHASTVEQSSALLDRARVYPQFDKRTVPEPVAPWIAVSAGAASAPKLRSSAEELDRLLRERAR